MTLKKKKHTNADDFGHKQGKVCRAELNQTFEAYFKPQLNDAGVEMLQSI